MLCTMLLVCYSDPIHSVMFFHLTLSPDTSHSSEDIPSCAKSGLLEGSVLYTMLLTCCSDPIHMNIFTIPPSSLPLSFPPSLFPFLPPSPGTG